MEGCSKYCSFCVVPYTRGDEVSRPFDSVLEEVRALARQGVGEILLLGQNVNAYAGAMADGATVDLATLIHHVAAIPDVQRIRFTTSHPLEFSDSLVEAYASVPQLANHLHLPVQSGSDRILALMKRGYTAPGVQAAHPPAARGAARHRDLHRHHRRLSRVRPNATSRPRSSWWRSVQFDQSFCFLYSRRPGTPAASLPDEVPLAAKQQRLARLQAQLDAQALAISRAHGGQRAARAGRARCQEGPRRACGPHREQPLGQLSGPELAAAALRRRHGHRGAPALAAGPLLRELEAA